MSGHNNQTDKNQDKIHQKINVEGCLWRTSQLERHQRQREDQTSDNSDPSLIPANITCCIDCS